MVPHHHTPRITHQPVSMGTQTISHQHQDPMILRTRPVQRYHMSEEDQMIIQYSHRIRGSHKDFLEVLISSNQQTQCAQTLHLLHLMLRDMLIHHMETFRTIHWEATLPATHRKQIPQ
jgi:hypothetical protein